MNDMEWVVTDKSGKELGRFADIDSIDAFIERYFEEHRGQDVCLLTECVRKGAEKNETVGGAALYDETKEKGDKE